MKSLLSCIVLPAGFCLAADSPYGTCAHLQRWEYDRASEELKQMKAAGIDHVRFDFDWDALETAPGVWNFDKMDSLAVMARGNGIRILPILAYDVKWATPAWKHLPEFLNYVGTVVRRYGDVMPCVEIWNEPNLQGFWRGKPSGREYASLLIPAYRKIKELNPGITVAYGGTSLIPLDYIEDSFKAGAAQAMDVMCIHPYRCNEMPEEYLASDLAGLRRLMARYGAGEKPVWFSEMGYSTVERLPYLSRVLPRLFAALGMTPETTTCVVFRDVDFRYDTEGLGFRIQDALPGLKAVRPIALKELKRLAAGTDTLLVLPDNESFPSEFLPDLTGYLRRGGRVLSPGGLPLYFDLRRDASGVLRKVQVNEKYMKELHLGWYTFWTRPGTPKKLEKQEFAGPHDDGQETLPVNGFRFFDRTNLAAGDQLEPVLYGRSGEFRGITAGVYHFNSDLKGKIAVCGNLNPGVPEKKQAEFLPRTMLIAFASGVERIYWYSFRSTERSRFDGEAHFGIVRNDLAPKDAYRAYRTLSELHPAGSTRPELRSDGPLYIANWKTPGNIPAAAVWNIAGEQTVKLKIRNGRLSAVRDHLGREVKLSPENSVLTFSASPGILYFSGVEL